MNYTKEHLEIAFNKAKSELKSIYEIKQLIGGRSWGKYTTTNIKKELLPILLPYVNQYYEQNADSKGILKALNNDIKKKTTYLKYTDYIIIDYVKYLFIPTHIIITKYKETDKAALIHLSNKVKTWMDTAEISEEKVDYAEENKELRNRIDEITILLDSYKKDTISTESVCQKIESCESKANVEEIYSAAKTLFNNMNILFTEEQKERIDKKLANVGNTNIYITGDYNEHKTVNNK